MQGSPHGSKPLEIGAVVDQRYRVEGLLGEGGMGVVYRAHDLQRGGGVALKVLHAVDLDDEESLARFEREAQLAAKVDTQGGVVRVHAMGWHGRLPYLVTELVEGQDLARALRAGRMEPGRLAGIVASVARTLHACHEAGVVHRDLKPANVLLPADGTRPRVVDFGLARGAGSQRLTRTGAILGTPQYMAPEQAVDAARATAPTVDIYQLGAILYRGLAGTPPFEGGSLAQVLVLVTSSEPAPPSKLQSGVPSELEGVCLKAMQKDPARRYPTALALAEDLERYRAGQAVEALPRTGSQRLAVAVRRVPAWLRRAAGAAVITALLAGALAYVLGAPARSAREALEACRAFDADTIAPYALGLGDGEAPDAARVRGTLDQIVAAREYLTGEALAEADRLGARLGALAALQSGVLPEDPESSWERVAAALLAQRRGEARAAFEGLQGVSEEEFPRLPALRRDLVRALFRSELERAPRSREGLAPRLEELERWLDAEEAVAIKRQVLVAGCPAWSQALREAPTRQALRETLTRLLAAAPSGPVEPLASSLGPLVHEWVERFDREEVGREELLGRIYELLPIYLRFTSSTEPDEALSSFIRGQIFAGHGPEPIVLGLSLGSIVLDRELILSRVDPASLQDLKGRWPWSRAVFYCEYQYEVSKLRVGWPPGRYRPMLETLRRILRDAALRDDLASVYIARAAQELAGKLLTVGDLEGWALDDPRWAEALEVLDRARAQLSEDSFTSLKDVVGLEAALAARLRGYEAGLSVWEARLGEVEDQFARIRGGGAKVPGPLYRGLAQAYVFAGGYAARKDRALAVRYGEKALKTLPFVAALETHQVSRAFLAEQYLASGDAARALSVLEPQLPGGLVRPGFAAAAVNTLRVLEDHQRADEYLQEALKANPSDGLLRSLRR